MTTTNDTLFHAALTRAADKALNKYPDETARILRGLSIAEAGGVTITASGAAQVVSQRDETLWYQVDARGCTCTDAATHAPEGKCKHVYATWLVKKAHKLMNAPRKAYYATLSSTPGMLYQEPSGAIVFLAEESDVRTVIGPEQVHSLVVLGLIALADAQRLQDLDARSRA